MWQVIPIVTVKAHFWHTLFTVRVPLRWWLYGYTMGTHFSQFGLRADFHTLTQTSVFRYAITHMGAIMALSSRFSLLSCISVYTRAMISCIQLWHNYLHAMFTSVGLPTFRTWFYNGAHVGQTVVCIHSLITDHYSYVRSFPVQITIVTC